MKFKIQNAGICGEKRMSVRLSRTTPTFIEVPEVMPREMRKSQCRDRENEKDFRSNVHSTPPVEP